ncbi:TetR/AcrR family transcriptional regulator [Leptospira gomenensis]|uniref:TetR/AcrR family transcriptional regulator n=1 Tax=Leptospira gomenensis TaxID=2484974 RepID=A0A5F1YU40_9LEPT|nr:TetR family transcriptional regulator C-terminal domain-containing protein [Leptospira gomenensis]TGK38609.1 TetR/AcrR family transcriptional regulator [Leptospira gomenensis]TGK42846.1 TetR/AcrR family transcriptional regulator [Leptospira gomenensis]TGK49609.1 TetR/AcrR family transcriptional regulator [Leptospira gomenensis]TGK60721.1 TetR/AcrR family transcriptional regulator [Leptospira gomenensis]
MANSGPTSRGKNTREKLLSDFKHLVSIHGILNTSLDRLSEYSGTAKSSILWHFGSREGLVIELVDRLFLEVETSVREGLTAGESVLPPLFEKFADFFIGTPEANGIFFTLILNESSDSKARKKVFEMYRGFRKKLAENILFKNSNVAETNLKTALLLALIDGLYLQWYLDPEEVPLKEALRMAQEMLVQYYETTGSVPPERRSSAKSAPRTVSKKSAIEKRKTSHRSK